MLGSESVEKLIAIGASTASRLEQTITHRFVTTFPGLRFVSLPPGYNFTYPAAKVIGEERFRSMGKQVKFLHYNTKLKPWQAADNRNWLDRIWLDMTRDAAEWLRQAAQP